MKTTFLKKILGLVSLAIVGVILAVTSGVAQNLPVVGLLVSGRSIAEFGQSNIPLVGIRYVGECPGEQSPSTWSRFFSQTTRPAPDLRAVVRNVSFGFAGETKPFTDREYFKGDVSEKFEIRFGDQHQGRYLTVQPGENQFEYEIKRNKQVIESGKFSATFEQRTIEKSRNTQLVQREEKYCRRYDKKDRHCIDEGTRTYYDRVCQ